MKKIISHNLNSLTIIIAESADRNILYSGATRVCHLLNTHSCLKIPHLDVIRVNPSTESVKKVFDSLDSPSVLMIGFESRCGGASITKLCNECISQNVPFIIVEKSIGNTMNDISAGQLIHFSYREASAIIREYDFIADEAVGQLVIDHLKQKHNGTLIIGDLATRVKYFLDEIQQDWNYLHDGNNTIYKPSITFQLAQALTCVPELNNNLDTYEKVAIEIVDRGWFAYNYEDVRKAVGALVDAWGLNKKNLRFLPLEAKKHGFPPSCAAKGLFEFIENLDMQEREFTSSKTNKFYSIRIFQ
jgi:hypothetical protein